MSIKRELFECDNCQKKWTESECNQAKHILSRVERGSIFTDLECPECGALCYSIGTERPQQEDHWQALVHHISVMGQGE